MYNCHVQCHVNCAVLLLSYFQVIICTDGLANKGVGTLDGMFYQLHCSYVCTCMYMYMYMYVYIHL